MICRNIAFISLNQHRSDILHRYLSRAPLYMANTSNKKSAWNIVTHTLCTGPITWAISLCLRHVTAQKLNHIGLHAATHTHTRLRTYSWQKLRYLLPPTSHSYDSWIGLQISSLTCPHDQTIKIVPIFEISKGCNCKLIYEGVFNIHL